MKVALSVRVAEPPRHKDVLAIAFEELAARARDAGFDGLSLRASAIAVTDPPARIDAVGRCLEETGLEASMVTGDLALAANNADAPLALRHIDPYLDLAERLGARLIRVMLHHEADVALAHEAAERARARGLTLCQQCHWGSLCETVDAALDLVERVDSTGFAITYEPANLLACGEPAGPHDAIARLSPHLGNVYFQNVVLDSQSSMVFPSRARGKVGVRFVPLSEPGDVEARALFDALTTIDYQGWFTVHQPLLPGQTVASAITDAARFVSPLCTTGARDGASTDG